MKKYSVLVLLGVFSLSLVSGAFAETSEGEKSVTGFFKRLFNYPVKATKETAGMTANTLHNTGEKVISKTGENTAAVVTGDVAKTTNIVTDNVQGVAETTGQAVAETAQTPVKAAEETPASN